MFVVNKLDDHEHGFSFQMEGKNGMKRSFSRKPLQTNKREFFSPGNTKNE